MRNNIIFILLCVAVFFVSAVAGWYGPEWRKEQGRIAEKSFVPPGVPDRVVHVFSRQFSNLMAATKPMRLPDEPFLDISGKERRFSDFAGKPTLVNFWATWCAPCVVELPALEKLAEHYRGRMNVVAVALEPNKRPEDIASFLEKRLLGGFAGYLDTSGKMMGDLGLQGLPTSFLIGSDGVILYRFEGDADWTAEDSRAFFDIFLLQKR